MMSMTPMNSLHACVLLVILPMAAALGAQQTSGLPPVHGLQTATRAAVLGGTAAAPQGAGWTHFVSATYRYSAWYPPGWRQMSTLDSIYIADFPQSQAGTGSVIPEQGAVISVGPTEVQGTISEQINAELNHAGVKSPILDQTLETGLKDPDAPTTLRQVEYYDNFGTATDPILQHVTVFYCEVHGRIFEVVLLYWRDNKNAKMLEGEALAIARTLRISK